MLRLGLDDLQLKAFTLRPHARNLDLVPKDLRLDFGLVPNELGMGLHKGLARLGDTNPQLRDELLRRDWPLIGCSTFCRHGSQPVFVSVVSISLRWQSIKHSRSFRLAK